MNISQWVDSLFLPLFLLLDRIYSYFGYLSGMFYGGLDVDRFLGPLSWLGGGVVFLIKALVTSTLAVGVIALIMALYRSYLNLKEGVKWW